MKNNNNNLKILNLKTIWAKGNREFDYHPCVKK